MSVKSDLHTRMDYHTRKWTYEICLAVAKQYQWMSDFRHFDRRCYEACLRDGWLSDFVWLKKSWYRGTPAIEVHGMDEYEFLDYDSYCTHEMD